MRPILIAALLTTTSCLGVADLELSEDGPYAATSEDDAALRRWRRPKFDAGVLTPTADAGTVISPADAGPATVDAGSLTPTPDAGATTPTLDAGIATVDAGTATPTLDAGIAIADAGTATPTPDAGAPDAGGNTAPFPTSGGATAVTTFHSIGLSWKAIGGATGQLATVEYRKQGEFTFKAGLPLWFDARNSEYRGSIVHLQPDTNYQVRLSLPGTATVATLTAHTWSEHFPVGRTVILPTLSSSTLVISASGTPTGYTLYTFAPGGSATIDVANTQADCIRITGSYVIIRGLKLRGAQRDGIRLEAGAHDVVIEDNDISNWGTPRDTTRNWGLDLQAGVHAAYRHLGIDRIVIQRNFIHDPRTDTNSWADGHPQGPQGITMENCALPDNLNCGSNHVIRYNDILGNPTHHLNDGIGGGSNFSLTGFPNADTDIYGNKIRYTWDDGIESEGGNRNVRIWGNYLDETFTGIATAVVSVGPLYVFRNVYDISRSREGTNTDSLEHGPFGKLGDSGGYGGGRRYFLHNTLLQQPPAAGQLYGLGAGGGPLGGWGTRPMVEVYSRNNIWQVHRANAYSLYGEATVGNNDIDYDLHNGSIRVSGTGNVIGSHLLTGTATYASGNGPVSRDNGAYALAAGSPGHDDGQPLPNFSDGAQGAGPDIGAHEAGTAPMRFGRAAATP